MVHEDKMLLATIGGVLVAGVIMLAVAVAHRGDIVKADQERQVQIDTFYRDHNCKPLGYVATKYEPVRTYQCDNGVFIPRDMGR